MAERTPKTSKVAKPSAASKRAPVGRAKAAASVGTLEPTKQKSGVVLAKASTKDTKPTTKSKSTHGTNALPAALQRLEARVVELKRERDAFEAALTMARAEIVELETARTEAINRIDWVLESLQSLLQTKA
jgi:hypothetical protein